MLLKRLGSAGSTASIRLSTSFLTVVALGRTPYVLGVPDTVGP